MSTKKLTLWRNVENIKYARVEYYWYFFQIIITLSSHFFQVLYEHKLTSLYHLCVVAEVFGENSLTILIETASLLWLSVLAESTLLPVNFFFLLEFCFSQHMF